MGHIANNKHNRCKCNNRGRKPKPGKTQLFEHAITKQDVRKAMRALCKCASENGQRLWMALDDDYERVQDTGGNQGQHLQG